MMVLAAAGGLVFGLVVGVALLRRSVVDLAQARAERWQAEEAQEIAREAAEKERYPTKRMYAGTWDAATSPLLPGLAADSRFVGDPVHLVVFDGDSDVKAGLADALRAVIFVAVGHLADADLVEECVAGGRVRWETLRIAPGVPEEQR